MNVFQLLALLLVLSAIVFSERFTVKVFLVAAAAVAFVVGIFAGRIL